ncbi:hypothetical protein EV401DRAFT_2007831 [Pisolithus croceorrhizus]|nr:hypothetical protein EV401DRAFT_2007831 [Pisolithus croceorrhizus]
MTKVSVSFLGLVHIRGIIVSSLLICLSAARAERKERGRANHLSPRAFQACRNRHPRCRESGHAHRHADETGQNHVYIYSVARDA